MMRGVLAGLRREGAVDAGEGVSEEGGVERGLRVEEPARRGDGGLLRAQRVERLGDGLGGVGDEGEEAAAVLVDREGHERDAVLLNRPAEVLRQEGEQPLAVGGRDGACRRGLVLLPFGREGELDVRDVGRGDAEGDVGVLVAEGAALLQDVFELGCERPAVRPAGRRHGRLGRGFALAALEPAELRGQERVRRARAAVADFERVVGVVGRLEAGEGEGEVLRGDELALRGALPDEPLDDVDVAVALAQEHGLDGFGGDVDAEDGAVGIRFLHNG